MTFKEHRKRILTLYDEIKNNSNLIVIDIEKDFEDLSEEDKQWEIDNIKNAFNIVLPEKMKEILFTNGAQICWNYRLDGREETGGEFRFKITNDIFINSAKTAFADRLTKWEKKIYKQGYRYFDSHPHAGDGKLAALKIENGTVTDSVWFVDIIHEEMWEMELDYADYIEHSLRLKGLYCWQFLFIVDPFVALGFNISSLHRRLEDYSRLFPNVDVTEYLERYDERA